MTAMAKPTLYLKHSCPFCLRLRIFLTEAQLADQVDFIVFEDGDATHQALRQQMEARGLKPSFPALKTADGEFETGTDDLIARFTSQHNIDTAQLQLLPYYESGVFVRMRELFMENRKLKGEA
ncbi:MAG: hypothetical protein RBS88_00625 [Spongiibacteraceae bacterium]|nr:hypothetical protein [Spongiibacteraceae bacterium]